MRIINDKIERSGGKRHYMPHYYYISRRRENNKSKKRKMVETVLSWIALLLIVLGLLSMLGVLGSG